MKKKLFNKIRAKLMPVKKELPKEIKNLDVKKEIPSVPMDFLSQNKNIQDIGKREFIKKGAIGLGVGAGAALLSKIPFADARLFTEGVSDTGIGTTPWSAGGVIYGSADNNLVALPKGAANTKLFINAGATLPEWSVGMKLISTSRDSATATGTQAITGFGFKPSGVLVFANVNTTTEMSISAADSSAAGGSYNQHPATNYIWNTAGTLVYVYEATGKAYSGSLNSFDADGLTISWTKTGDKVGTIQLKIFAWR